jgi:hypothetical protein
MRVTNLEPTTVQLTWTGSASAVRYVIYVRSVQDNTRFGAGSPVTGTWHGVGFLFPGTWNFEFCVAAFNGNFETAHSARVIPPVYPGFRKRDEVIGNATVVTNSSTEYDSATMVDDTRLRMLYQLMGQTTEDSIDNSTIPLE